MERKEGQMTKREYLVSLGQKVGKRGRFSKEQVELISKAEAQGTVFTK
jgi:hypothetical protein